MKFVYFFLITSFILLLLYWRLRPYIHAVRKAFQAVKRMQEGGVGGPILRTRETAAADNRQLIKCANCGTWVLETRAIAPAGGRQLYCSHTCYEEGLVKTR